MFMARVGQIRDPERVNRTHMALSVRQHRIFNNAVSPSKYNSLPCKSPTSNSNCLSVLNHIRHIQLLILAVYLQSIFIIEAV
jgi:hypothetical protein